MFFSSFKDPDGWATALQLILFNNFKLSVKGKKPSETQINFLDLKNFL